MLFKSMVYEKDLFLESYLNEIQKFIFGFRNFELFFEILTKEYNPTHKFYISKIIS